MTQNDLHDTSNHISEVYGRESRRVLATLIRLISDFDLAEEMMHEAFAAAVQQWPDEGIPANPYSWLVSAARFKAIDAIRRRSRFAKVQPDLVVRLEEVHEDNETLANSDIKDDRLRLIFTCCHPAIDATVQVPLTLREVCGLTTEEIARAFLTTPATMAQRIVRGKAKIRDAAIPFVIPALEELPERLDAVLSVIYLIFNEGYSASSGDSITRADLSGEAIRLCRLVLELHEDSEVIGLLALMLLHESRRETRQTVEGDIVLLEDQDRSRWNRELISEGHALVERSLATRGFGPYTIQAAISAVHAEATTAADTDWNQIVSLYDVLLRVASSPVVELNRAVAVAMRDGALFGLEIIDAILDRGELTHYALAHSARGELLRRSGRSSEALAAFEKATTLTDHPSEKRFLSAKIEALRS